MSRRDSATRLLLLASLAKQVSRAEAELKETVREDFDQVGVRDVGVVGDEQFGHVRVDRGSKTPGVIDPAAFLDWAKTHHPEAVEVTERVRPDVQSRWLAEVKTHGGVLNEATGELEEPAGVIVRQGDSRLVVVPSKDAPEIIGRAIASGALDLGSVLAIGAGESGE